MMDSLTINPLDLPHVVEKVIFYLESQADLLNCRLVNQLWDISSLKQLRLLGGARVKLDYTNLHKYIISYIQQSTANTTTYYGDDQRQEGKKKIQLLVRYVLDLQSDNFRSEYESEYGSSSRPILLHSFVSLCLAPNTKNRIESLTFNSGSSSICYLSYSGYREEVNLILEIIRANAAGLKHLALLGTFCCNSDNSDYERCKGHLEIFRMNFPSLNSFYLDLFDTCGQDRLGNYGVLGRFINTLAPKIEKLHLKLQCSDQSRLMLRGFNAVTYSCLTYWSLSAPPELFTEDQLASVQTPRLQELKLALTESPDATITPLIYQWLSSNSNTLTSFEIQFPKSFPETTFGQCLPILPNVEHFGYSCTDAKINAGTPNSGSINWHAEVADKFRNLKSVSTHLALCSCNNFSKKKFDLSVFDEFKFSQVQTLTLESKRKNYKRQSSANVRRQVEMMAFMYPSVQKVVLIINNNQEERTNNIRRVKEIGRKNICYEANTLAWILTFFDGLKELEVVNYDQEEDLNKIFKIGLSISNINLGRIQSLSLHSNSKYQDSTGTSTSSQEFGCNIFLLLSHFPMLGTLKVSKTLLLAGFKEYKVTQATLESTTPIYNTMEDWLAGARNKYPKVNIQIS